MPAPPVTAEANEAAPPIVSGEIAFEGVSKIWLVAETEGCSYRLATIAFGKSDASLYITPGKYVGGQGFAGQLMVPAPGDSNTFNFTRQKSGYPLKITIHESGWTHATAATGEVEPAFGRALLHHEVSHIATVQVFSLVGLPQVEDPGTARCPHVSMRLTGMEWTSARVLLYVCPDQASARTFGTYVTLVRPRLPRPLYLAFESRVNYQPDSEKGAGVLVLGGWGPAAKDDSRPFNGVVVVSTSRKDVTEIGNTVAVV